AALQQVLRDFATVTLEREMGITIIERSANRLTFAWEGRRYVVLIVPSTSAADAIPTAAPGETIIYLANLPEHRPQPDLLWFDIATLSARVTGDPVYESLRIFMQRYYGMRFTL
ncbi:MAG: hypothetical protein ACK4SA_12320, partial [Caldilinea sp.]